MSYGSLYPNPVSKPTSPDPHCGVTENKFTPPGTFLTQKFFKVALTLPLANTQTIVTFESVPSSVAREIKRTEHAYFGFVVCFRNYNTCKEMQGSKCSLGGT